MEMDNEPPYTRSVRVTLSVHIERSRNEVEGYGGAPVRLPAEEAHLVSLITDEAVYSIGGSFFVF